MIVQQTGGCYDTAKRNYLNISEIHIKDLERWKKHYGLRQVGYYLKNNHQFPVYSGLDTFKLISSQGYDLEINILDSIILIHGIIDWLTFVQCATYEGWIMKTILLKIENPITDVYGKDYWLEVKKRISLWFIEYMKNK